MPKRFITILVAFPSVLMLTGCRSVKPSLEVMPHDDNTITFTADRAGISGVGGAGITIAEGQKLIIDSLSPKAPSGSSSFGMMSPQAWTPPLTRSCTQAKRPHWT